MNKSNSYFNIALLLIALVSLLAWNWARESRMNDKHKPIEIPKIESPQVLETPKEPFSESEMITYRQILVSYSTGDFSSASLMVEKTLLDKSISDGFREWLLRQQPILLTSLAWSKIKTQDCDDAIKIFYRALSLFQVPEAQKGLGYCLRVIKNWPEAASYLALYVLSKPSDIEGRLIYADTLESLGRFDDAVVILEGATQQQGVDSKLLEMAAERLTAMRAKAKSGAGQKTERSENFFVSYHEEAHDGILRQVLDILEAAMNEYSGLLGVTPPQNPVEVILYRKEDFLDVVPGGPGWAEGVFDGRMRVPVSAEMLTDVEGRLAIVLRHELSHAVLSNRGRGRAWPTWFDEGLAQYLACRSRACEGFRFPAKISEFSPSEKLIRPFVTLDDVQAGSAYLHSLYLVRVIVRSRGEDVLDFISNRIPPSGAISSDFVAEAAGWSSFDELWSDAARRWQSHMQP